MRLQVGRRGDGGQRERAGLLPAVVLSVEVRALLGLGPAVGGHWRHVRIGVRMAQTLVCPQGPAPPAQLGLERLDLPPQRVVVLLQRLILLWVSGRPSAPALHPNPSMSPAWAQADLSLPSPLQLVSPQTGGPPKPPSPILGALLGLIPLHRNSGGPDPAQGTPPACLPMTLPPPTSFPSGGVVGHHTLPTSAAARMLLPWSPLGAQSPPRGRFCGLAAQPMLSGLWGWAPDHFLPLPVRFWGAAVGLSGRV